MLAADVASREGDPPAPARGRGNGPTGRLPPPAAGLAWPARVCLLGSFVPARLCGSGLADEVRGLLTLADLHLARLGLLGDGDRYLKDAIAVAGLDAIGVQRVGQAHPTGDCTHYALPDDGPAD